MCSSNEEKLLAEQQENLHVVIQRSSLHNRLLPSAVVFPTRLYKQNEKTMSNLSKSLTCISLTRHMKHFIDALAGSGWMA